MTQNKSLGLHCGSIVQEKNETKWLCSSCNQVSVVSKHLIKRFLVLRFKNYSAVLMNKSS